jgi:hypothetical protein
MTTPKHIIEIMQKAARCWSGYEPVPGAKAYSEGSCRPKGSKKTKKEVIKGKDHSEPKEKRGEYYTGKYSHKPFNANHARKTLGPSASDMSDEDAYNDMISKFESGSLDPVQFQAFNKEYGKYRPKFQATPAATQPPQVQAPQAQPQTGATTVKPPQPQAPVTSPAPAPPPASSLQRPKARQMQANPVPAIDARLQRKGIDPSKPVFAKAAPTPPVTPKIVQNVTRPR